MRISNNQGVGVMGFHRSAPGYNGLMDYPV